MYRAIESAFSFKLEKKNLFFEIQKFHYISGYLGFWL